MRRVSATIVAVEKRQELHIVNVCSLRYPVCMRTRRTVICSLSGRTISSTVSHKRHNFRKKSN